MKKIVFGLVGLFIASQLMVSCSADNELLSQFSKRKYLKKFKAKDVKYEDKIGELETELAFTEAKKSQTEKTIVASTNETIESSTVQLENKVEAVQLSADKKEQLTKVKTLVNDYSDWNKYNRNMDFSFTSLNKVSELKSNNYAKSKGRGGMSTGALIVAIILLLLWSPGSVLIADKNQFPLNILLWGGGVALMIIGAISSIPVLYIIGFVAVFVSWIHAIIVVVKNA